jgi:putative oxidoreductase
MFKRMLSSKLLFPNSFFVIRVIIGILIAKEGFQVFNKSHMDGNFAWLKDIHFPAPVFMAYVGKTAELIGGISLAIGLLTRFSGLVLVIDMAVITFIMGSGKFWNQDELPFLLLLIFACFIFLGGGIYSLDHLLFNKASSPSGEGRGEATQQ